MKLNEAVHPSLTRESDNIQFFAACLTFVIIELNLFQSMIWLSTIQQDVTGILFLLQVDLKQISRSVLSYLISAVAGI